MIILDIHIFTGLIIADGRHLHLINENCYPPQENTDGDLSVDPSNRTQNPIDKLYSMAQNAYYCSAC